MTTYSLDDRRVTREEGVWIAPTAVVIGEVILKRNAGVWWNAVLRGDNEPITVGEGSNVQDGSVLHTDPGFPLTIGRDVTVGHMAMLHGCTIGDGVLIGMGAIVLNGAVIGDGAVIGAGSLVPEGKVIPANALAVGSPAKVVREAEAALRERVREGSEHYVGNARRYERGLKRDD